MPCSFPCERAYVHFVNDLAFQRDAGPLRIAPKKLRRIDNTGRTMRSSRLKTRGRVRVKIPGTIQAESVASASPCLRMSRKIASLFSFQRTEGLGEIFRFGAFQDDINALDLWSPHAEVRLVSPDEFSANGVATSEGSRGVVCTYGHFVYYFVLLLKSFETTPAAD